MEYKCEKCGNDFSRTEKEITERTNNMFFRSYKLDYCDSCLKILDYHGKYEHRVKDNTLKLNLLENAFDYLNCSISFVIKAEKENNLLSWKYAIINIVITIELLLKEILRQQNYLLIYEDLNHYQKITRETKTVSWSVAIERIKLLFNSKINEIDKGRLQLAQKLRNQMLHYDVELIPQKAFKDFSNLINFVIELYDSFLFNYTEKPIEKFIYPENWEQEEIIINYFGNEFTNYNGYVIYREFIEDQKYSHIIIDGEKYQRIKFGDEPKYILNYNYEGFYEIACHDCDAIEGLYHCFGCDVEICPKCHGQLLSCDCLECLDDVDKAEN